MCVFKQRNCYKYKNTVIPNMSFFKLFKYAKTVIQHKKRAFINDLTELQGFFIKTIVRFSFINIFAFC
ncbi:hypothetical protein DXC10_04120 [Bacteroides sp. OM08-11]|nr:hypothetical protein DXC10_04120 [Bacteroides sp. OM08-11]